jgi:hypothetical protein
MAALIRAEHKKAILQALYFAVEDETAAADLAADDISRATLTLREALKGYLRLCFSGAKTGNLSLGSSGYAHEVRWASPDILRSYSQEEVFAFAGELIEIYDAAKAVLVAAGNATPTDIQIFQEMMDADALHAPTFTTKDHTALRFGG